VGSAKSGPKVAAILSVVESCRRLGVPVKEYLLAVLPGMKSKETIGSHSAHPGATEHRVAPDLVGRYGYVSRARVFQIVESQERSSLALRKLDFHAAQAYRTHDGRKPSEIAATKSTKPSRVHPWLSLALAAITFICLCAAVNGGPSNLYWISWDSGRPLRPVEAPCSPRLFGPCALSVAIA